MIATTRYRCPAHPSFWVHPRQGCLEVSPQEEPRGFLERRFGADDAGAPYRAGWVSAMRWVGAEPFWLIRCASIRRQGGLIQWWARYLCTRFPYEEKTGVTLRPEEGEAAHACADWVADGGLSQGRVQRPHLPGNPDTVLLGLRRAFTAACVQPCERRYHPDYPGFWVHPAKGTFTFETDRCHSDFFRAHPELFGGYDWDAAFADGWAALRRWTGYRAIWVLRYGDLAKVVGTLRRWAKDTVAAWPEEGLTPLRCIPALAPACLTGNLGALATGRFGIREDPTAMVPPPGALPPYCTGHGHPPRLCPWPDYTPPQESAFVPLYPANGAAAYYTTGNLRKTLGLCEHKLATPGACVGTARFAYRLKQRSLRSWIHQIDTGTTPPSAGDTYREWLDYLRQDGPREASE